MGYGKKKRRKLKYNVRLILTIDIMTLIGSTIYI